MSERFIVRSGNGYVLDPGKSPSSVVLMTSYREEAMQMPAALAREVVSSLEASGLAGEAVVASWGSPSTETLGVQELVRKYCKKWEAVGTWKRPDLADALDWMVTEVAEAVEARLMMSGGWVRNNPTAERAFKEDVAVEIFDAITMGCVALDCLGMDLMGVARWKLNKMDERRHKDDVNAKGG